MENLTVPRIIISGVCASSGTSLVTLALLCELKRRGLGVSCGVVGPHLAQAVLYKRLVGRSVRCFDDRILAPGQNLVTAYQASIGADIIVIEGRPGGLYDGVHPESQRGSTAELAGFIHTPVILVADPEGFGASLGALVKGYRDCAIDFSVVSAILSRPPAALDSELSAREFFDATMQSRGLQGTLGVLPAFDPPALPEFPFSQKTNRSSVARQFLMDLSNLANQHIDVDGVIAAAAHATPIRITEYDHRPLPRRTRIAVSDDACFSLGFQDNLELLRYYGAEVVSFSPLADDEIPERIGGLYLTGGYLEEYAAQLADNKSLMESIARFVDSGGVVFAEGAGCAYLCHSYKFESGETFPGAGVIGGTAVADSGKFSYVEAVTMEESVLGRTGLIVKGVSTSEWKLASQDRVLKVLRYSSAGSGSSQEGYSPGAQVVGTFSFLHLGSNPELAKNLVDAAEVVHKNER